MARLRTVLSNALQGFRAQVDYWHSLPDRAVVKLLLAVFFMFSTTGIVSHIQQIAATGKSHWLNALIPSVFAGASAAAFVLAFIRDKRLLLVVIPFQIAGGWLFAGVGDSVMRPLGPDQIVSRMAAYANLTFFTLMLGYIFFIDFIVREGVKHMGLRAEMALAERTHRFLVPPLDLRTERLEAYGQSQPSSQVGGDLLDAADHDGNTLLYVADVSGHGVAAGTLMSLTKGAMRARLLAGVPLSELVGDLNRVLIDLSSPNMFVTFAGIRFGDSSTAEVSLAGHLPILHFERGSGKAAQLPNESVPLGILADAEFGTASIPFGTGDVFAILTDGLTEVENAVGEELGVDGVELLIGRDLDRSLEEIHRSVMAAVGKHGPQLDDQTLLLIRVG